MVTIFSSMLLLIKNITFFISLSSWSRYFVYATRVVYCVALRRVTLSRRVFASLRMPSSLCTRRIASSRRIVVPSSSCSRRIASSLRRAASSRCRVVVPSSSCSRRIASSHRVVASRRRDLYRSCHRRRATVVAPSSRRRFWLVVVFVVVVESLPSHSGGLSIH